MISTAAGVERHAADWAPIRAREILRDGELRAAGATENRSLRLLLERPRFDRMPSDCVVALFARKVRVAAFQLDGNDVERRVVMATAGLGVKSDPAHLVSHTSMGILEVLPWTTWRRCQ